MVIEMDRLIVIEFFTDQLYLMQDLNWSYHGIFSLCAVVQHVFGRLLSSSICAKA